MSAAKKPRAAAVVAGIANYPVVDRHGKPVRVGDRLQVQHCIGRYGQTRIDVITVEEAYWQYCQYKGAVAYIDYEYRERTGKTRMILYHEHVDYEHGHTTWGEVIT